jgi:hypothetical protein
MIEPDLGMVYSRVGSEIAIPVLDWEGMTPSNNFATKYNLEKFNVLEVCQSLRSVIRTKKIPKHIKNQHRRFWGMKQL